MPGPSNPETLERAAPLLGQSAAELAPRVRDGVLDLLDERFAPTATQRFLDTAATAWLYDRIRDVFAPRGASGRAGRRFATAFARCCD